MRIAIEIPDDENGPDSVKRLLDCLILIWGRHLAKHPFLPVYSANVRYQQEPNAGQYEVWKSPSQTYSDGWGDCDDLTLWRGAELVASGERASCQCLAQKTPVGTRMHVLVRRGNGRTEDPSVEVEKRHE